jgi:tetratricopeptide (TPR) repeat protein
MNGTSEEPKKAFTMPEHAGDPPSESRTLVEALEDGTLQALPKRRQKTLMRFLTRRLLEEWNEARDKLNFKNGARIASLMVRIEASQANVWRLAFACQQSGDSKGAAEASQRLLESFPGSSVALLSAALLSDSTNTEELRAIVDAIDPATIRLPSVRSTWGRTAIRAGRVEDGLAVLEKLIDKGTPLLMDRVVAASSMRSKGENARALSLLGPVGSGPTAPLNWRVLRARLLLETGHREEARALAQSILEAFPFESRAKQVLEKCSAP